jgi:multifunctional 2-oxoglutarate metabolism enzyme
VIDNFIAAAGEKWGQQSALVLLLPHGFEGQGPEHSSARLERYLQLCAGGNMTVAQPTTSAQYFHLLRAQVLRSVRRPLVVMTPKSLLRARQARSSVDLLVDGRWSPVLDDDATAPGAAIAAGAVTRVVLCSGKVAYDAISRRDEVAAAIAVVRVEQLHPWPEQELSSVIGRYPAASDIVWLQEEPANMGGATYVQSRLPGVVPAGAAISYVSRPEAGSPATGSGTVHQLELRDILDRSIGPVPEDDSQT